LRIVCVHLLRQHRVPMTACQLRPLVAASQVHPGESRNAI
jgi:hypothetical protein